MLRIRVEESSGNSKVLLDGKLAGDWVKELDQVWRTILDSASARNVILDLSGVTFVDAEGKRLLTSMMGCGARFQEPQLLVKFIVEEMQNGHRNLKSA